MLKWDYNTIRLNLNAIATVVNFHGLFDLIYTYFSPILPVVFGAPLDTENANFVTITITT